MQCGENEYVEFKHNYIKPDDIGERISGLSNSANLENKLFGYLIFGVEDKTNNIVGTNYDFKAEKIGNNPMENYLTQMMDCKIDFKIYEFKYQGKKMVIFKIPAAVIKPTMFKNIAYVRVGSVNRKLKDFSDKERKIWNNTSNRSFETEIAEDNLSDDEVLALLDYGMYFKLLELPMPSNRLGILQKLFQDGLIFANGSHYNITNLGALLLANNLADFDNLKNRKLRIINYKGTNKVTTIKEFEIKKGYAVGFADAIECINNILPSNEEIQQAFRVEKKIYPEIAIRELLANALIHQDFYLRGLMPIVDIFSDRLEISNPGKPLVDTNRFIDHSAKSRNEKLAASMRLVKICEQRGSGIDKVIFNIELYQLPAPSFETFDDFTRVTLYQYKKLSQMSKDDKVRACYHHCCLRHVSNEKMTNASLRKRFNIIDKNYAIASRIIRDAKDAGFIKLSGVHSEYIPFWA